MTVPLKPPASDQGSPTLTSKTQVKTTVVSSTPNQKPGRGFPKLEVKTDVEPPTSDQKVETIAAQEALPECTGTGSVPYNPNIVNDGFKGNQQVKYDNICAMTQYSKYSPEELRLADPNKKL